MIKQLILLIQVLGLFFYQLIFTGDIAVTQKFPDSLIQGKEAVIEITINKDDVTGFAKFQQVLPKGFTAEPIETKGATFSFKDSKVKFIWMALPAEKEFTISYKLKPNQSTLGDFTVGGKFSFITDSDRKNIVIPIADFSVISEELVSEAAELDPIEEDVDEESIIEEDIVADVEVEEVLTPEAEVLAVDDENTKETLTINCKRSIENLENGKFKVSVEINKKGVEGFAKIIEEIPDGFLASKGNSKGGAFSFKKNEVKILWMAVPTLDVYVISYNIEAVSSTLNGDYNIIGYYSYLDNKIITKYDISRSVFNLNIEEVILEEPVEEVTKLFAVEETLTEPKTEEIVDVVPEMIKEEISESVAKIEDSADLDKSSIAANNMNKITSTSSPENGVTYKVQVGAGHRKVSSTYFKTKFNLKDNVSTINHEGWIKYLVGSYDEYKSARDKRNTLRKNVKTAFVTAYNSGIRITVQEALMISSQKWYK
jgi:hypothetical protein